MNVQEKNKEFLRLKNEYHALKIQFSHDKFRDLKKEYDVKKELASPAAIKIASYRRKIIDLGRELNQELTKLTEEKRNA